MTETKIATAVKATANAADVKVPVTPVKATSTKAESKATVKATKAEPKATVKATAKKSTKGESKATDKKSTKAESKEPKRQPKPEPDMKKVKSFVKMFLRTDIENTIFAENLKETIKLAKRNDVSPKELKKYQTEYDNFEIWPEEFWKKFDETLNPAEQSICVEISDSIERIIRKLMTVTKDKKELQSRIKDILQMLNI